MKLVHSAIFIAALTLSPAMPSRAGLLITEVMSQSGAGGTNDWFELTNNGSRACHSGREHHPAAPPQTRRAGLIGL